MEEKKYNGKILYRYLHIQAIILLIFIVNFGLLFTFFEKEMIGRSILILILLFVSISFSFSNNVIINDNYFIFENPITKFKRLYEWSEIAEINEREENLVDGIMKLTIRFLIFGLFSFFIENRKRSIIIKMKDETLLYINDYRIKGYEDLKEKILEVIKNRV